MTETQLPLVVVKVGGSLFDHPALGPGLRRWLAEQPPARHVFVPGGGALADVIRDYHRTHAVPEETCHWLAIQTMSINARLLDAQIPGAETIDALTFCRDDEANDKALPHTWRVTSDSIAARVAEALGASRLILLKSTNSPGNMNWREMARDGLVDDMFPEVVQRSRLIVKWLNFRAILDGFC